jgi:hypothetical protein
MTTEKTYTLNGFELAIQKEKDAFIVTLHKNGFSTPLKTFWSLKNAERFIALVLSF